MPFTRPDIALLTEETSLAFVSQIQAKPITTTLSLKPILTTYVCQGEVTPPIVLLHGFDSSILEFRRLLPQLAFHYQTWAVDLLGFGFTERLPDLAINAIAIKTHLYAYWQTLIQRPMVLVGASMGGATAIDFALTYPDAVSHLILLDSAGLTHPPLSSQFMFPVIDRIATNILRNPYIRQAISRAAYFDKTFASEDARRCAALHLSCPRWQEALISFTKSGGYGSFAAQLPTLTIPTLILWGRNDRILGQKAPNRFHQLIRPSQLQWIDECGHVPHLEKPQVTAEKIKQWLDSKPHSEGN